MAKFTIHIFHPRQGMTSPFDYEGWAHPRAAHWTEEAIEGTLEDARARARMLRARAADGDHITDETGNKFDLTEPQPTG